MKRRPGRPSSLASPSASSSVKKVGFTFADLAWLLDQAVKRRMYLTAVGNFPDKIYEENRFEFIRAYAAGTIPAETDKEQRWLRKVKAEIEEKSGVRSQESGVLAGRAIIGASRPSAA